jgi:phosphoglycolate phosphatase
MRVSNDKKLALIILDIDNTIFDWVKYYVHSFRAMMSVVEKTIGKSYEQLAAEAAIVFENHGSIEYPFLVQELPAVIAHYGEHLDQMLSKLVEPARAAFKSTAIAHLKPYPGVPETFFHIRRAHPDSPIVALTDAPRYVAMWKLNKLGLLHEFDAVYGLADPRLPTDSRLGRVKVDPKILLKHLQQNNFGYQGKIRVLPDEYEKPGTRGLKTVLMDFEIDEDAEAKSRTLWVGDNLRKDVGLGHRVGVMTAWAKYGTFIDEQIKNDLLQFSPPMNVHKNASLDPQSDDAPRPKYVLEQFSDLQVLFGKPVSEKKGR